MSRQPAATVLSLLCLCAGARAAGVPTAALPDLSSLRFFAQPASGDPAPGAAPAGQPTAVAAASRGDAVPLPPTSAAVLSERRAAALDGHEVSRETLAAIEQRVAAIRAIEARQGPRSSELASELAALADLYREAGDHPLVLDALRRELDVVRANAGLHSLDQVPIVEGLIASTLELGDFARAAELDESVLELAFRNPDDPRVAAILIGVADRQMAAVSRFLEYGPPPQIDIDIDIGLVPGLPQGVVPARRTALRSLYRARRYYNNAIIAAQRNGPAHDIAELFAIEAKLLDTFHVEVTNPELYSSGASRPGDVPVFRPGEAAFKVHVENSATFRRTATAVASALLKLGDWQLIFSRNGTALRTYRTAHDLLVREGVERETIEALLAPDVPIMLPDFEPPDVADEGDTLAYRGYVDLSFVLRRYGTVSDVRVVGASSDTPKAVLKRAERYVARSRFRPRLATGVPERTDEIAVRYYYDY